MYQFRQVLVRMRQGDADREIARSGLMGRRKAGRLRLLAEKQGWLDPAVPLPEDTELSRVLSAPRILRSSCVSSLESHRAIVEDWAAKGIQGTTVFAALVRRHGYTGSYSAVRRFMKQIERSLPPADATVRLSFDPAEAAQIDFGSGPEIIDAMTGEVMRTWIFVMTLCWSRHQYAEVVRDQTVATWLSCHRHALEWFGGVPGKMIIDNAKCAITRACIHDPDVQRSYADFAEGYGFRISACPPRDPQKKGIVESGVKYIKKAFLPLRDFRGIADANRQLQAWILADAGNRCHGTTREKPLSRFASEKDLLARLPDVPPELATWAGVILHRDCHVQFERNYYSAPFLLIRQKLWLKATPGVVTLYHAHVLVATHPRLAGQGRRSTVRDHLPPHATAYAMRDPQWCLAESRRVGVSCHALVERLFADRVLDHLRAAQGLLKLGQKFGAQRLEAACARALAFDAPRYRDVKAILHQGLDQSPDPFQQIELSDTYARGGRYCRNTKTLFDPPKGVQ